MIASTQTRTHIDTLIGKTPVSLMDHALQLARTIYAKNARSGSDENEN